MVHNLDPLSDDALYLYHVSFVPCFKNISQRVSELLSGCNLNTEFCHGA